MIEELAYIMANPVEAGLVDTAEEWPGVMALPEELGTKTWTIERPNVFFDSERSMWPETSVLRLRMPATQLTDAELRCRVKNELGQLETEARGQVQAKHVRALGRSGILEISPRSRAKSREPMKGLNPNFAVGRGQKSAFIRAVQALRTFRGTYREALVQWRQGIRDVLFPKYTWQMSWLHAVQVESA
jgi:hypothetical protein